MTDLTSREILDIIHEGMKEVWQQFAMNKSGQGDQASSLRDYPRSKPAEIEDNPKDRAGSGAIR